MASIRRSTEEDIDTLVEMGAALCAESPRYRDKQYDPAKVRMLLQRIIDGQIPGLVLTAQASWGEIVGVAVVVAGERWFGPDRYVTDLTVYIKPQNRGNGAFFRLVRAIEAWAAEQGIADLDLGVSTGIHAERTVRAYESEGYTLHSTSVMTKRLTNVYRR